MTCDDYLAMLETLPVDELAHGAAREHATICHDCNRVTRVVAERERNMLVAYGEVMPFAPPAVVASSAIAAARRRRLALFYRGGLVLAGVAVVIVIALSRVVRMRAAASSFAEQRFTLRCLSAERAAGIVRGGIPDPLRTSIQARRSEGVLIVGGSPHTIEVARSVLDQYDAQCASGQLWSGR